jgi:hypothetical protein
VIRLTGSPVGCVTDVGTCSVVARVSRWEFRQARSRLGEEDRGGGNGRSGATRARSALTERQESNGRRETLRLVEWEKL